MDTLKSPALEALAPYFPRLIAIHAFAGQGKTLAASAMEDLGYSIEKLAGPLKEMLRTLLAQIGVPRNRVERMIEGDLKEVPCDELGGKSPRHAMQTLGEEWGRQCIGESFWVDKAIEMVKFRQRTKPGVAIFIDDLRYANELVGLRCQGFVMWKITGRPRKDVGQHASEEGLPDHLFDHVFHNTGSPERFKSLVTDEVFRLAALAEFAA